MLLCHTVGWIHLSVGKPERWLRWSVFQLAATVSLFLLALRWGPEGVAAAWSISFWTLLIPGFWYAGRPVGFGVSDLIVAIWRYAAAALAAGLITAAIMRGTLIWGSYSGTGAALEATVIISILFVTLYLGAVILFHWGLAPLRQLASLLRELAPARKDTRPPAEAVGAYY
jgi:PST family polysaccharide transporter